MSMARPIDWTGIAPDVARTLWGEPNPRLSGQRELRWGSKGSKRLKLHGRGKGQRYDREAGQGGGVLDMARAYAPRASDAGR